MGKFLDEFKYDKTKYEIVVFFFDAMLNTYFMSILDDMSNDMGSFIYTTGYTFASGCDEEDIANGDYFENGVMFALNEEDIIVDYNFFYECLQLACDIYLENHQEDREEVGEKLKIIQKRYNIII